jgi:hypothetical protein
MKIIGLVILAIILGMTYPAKGQTLSGGGNVVSTQVLVSITASYKGSEFLTASCQPNPYPTADTNVKPLLIVSYTTGAAGQSFSGKPRYYKLDGAGHAYFSGYTLWQGKPASYRLNVWSNIPDFGQFGGFGTQAFNSATIDLNATPSFTITIYRKGTSIVLFQREGVDGKPLVTDAGSNAQFMEMPAMLTQAQMQAAGVVAPPVPEKDTYHKLADTQASIDSLTKRLNKLQATLSLLQSRAAEEKAAAANTTTASPQK